MADVNQPSLVRYPDSGGLGKPGMHSHNTTRLRPGNGRRTGKIRALLGFRAALLVIGLCALAYYGYTLADEYVYQRYENWAFEQQIAGRPKVNFGDYLRERTPFGFLARFAPTTNPPVAPSPPVPSRPPEGSVVGKVEIGRLHLSAMVREGVDPGTLSVAVGHVPSTALPGQPGNFAIAAHRDTLFRALKDIQKGDQITFQTLSGTYQYQVAATKIVKPSDVSVLHPDGGGLIPSAAQSSTPPKLLTMITCYPFYYVGAAPKRFIVQAEQVSSDPASHLPAPPPAAPAASDNSAASQAKAVSPAKPQHSTHGHIAAARRAHTHPPLRPANPNENANAKHAHKRGFWHRLLHVS